MVLLLLLGVTKVALRLLTSDVGVGVFAGVQVAEVAPKVKPFV